MDAPESERDIFIQKHAADFVADFDRSLEPLLRKPNGQFRRRVRIRESSRLTSHVLEHFQELPQLLDPHLPRWLPVLADAYLQCLQDRRRSRALSTRSQLLHPLSNAICRIIYTFCKIRGEKVIVRFLNVETRYLEVLLQAIEDSERETKAATKTVDSALCWTWHERYIVLIWLSQLFFAPFDLSTISSGEAEEFDQPRLPGFQWPDKVPRIALRVIPLAARYLASPGKERDGAKALLVRLAMRKDMQELGVLDALVQWALYTLRPGNEDISTLSPYHFIGSLSFLAGVLRASENTSIMDKHLETIFYAVQIIASEENEIFRMINGSAIARKVMIKVARSIITLILRKSRQSMADTEMVETTIGYLLERLADNDTPVRFAASKALSIITFKLDPDMASQVIEAVIESLNRNVLWVKSGRDLTAVDPLEWHGLMLTLSHLLYRRSPPPEDLSAIIHALLIGLSFEKRSPSGGSIGSNVRDASCFGIWALARRYSTAEVLQVETQSVLVARGHEPTASILQVIATKLVVTASLDPAGNIRRGASAALQELIGRHPDTVDQGISVVQVVDYHAVALRSRAIHEVALRATKLSPHYGRALLEATLGWRGIGDMDADARRVAAASYGSLATEMARTSEKVPLQYISSRIDLLMARIKALQVRQVEERHGLILTLAATHDSIPSLLGDGKTNVDFRLVPVFQIHDGLKKNLEASENTTSRKPELIVEAISTLVVSSVPSLLVSLFGRSHEHTRLEEIFQKGSDIVNDDRSNLFPAVVEYVDAAQANKSNLEGDLLEHLRGCVDGWLARKDVAVMSPASKAALVLLLFSSPSNRTDIVAGWRRKVSQPQAPRDGYGDGFFHALCQSYPLVAFEAKRDEKVKESSIADVLTERWTKDVYTDTHAAILQSFTDTAILRKRASDFKRLISEGLDDYTTTARGDVGSQVRLEAVKATKTIWSTEGIDEELKLELFPQILRLAAEKLDRVRAEAQSALAIVLKPEYTKDFNQLSFSSKEYFSFLFTLCSTARLNLTRSDKDGTGEESYTASLLAGMVTSADTGNEDLVVVTRAALAELCETSDDSLRRVCVALLYNLKRYASQDRVLVATLEVVAYLFHVGLLQQCCVGGENTPQLNLRSLCLLVQKAAYKTGNVRKLEACIKVYGAIVATSYQEMGVAEAKKRLGALLLHPWPRVRSLVVDELWSCGLLANDYDGDLSAQEDKGKKLLSVDWGKAGKSYVKSVVAELGL
ncbi:beta-tubulin cofactor d, partial [Xylariaceae sp. FL0255]